jgi:hypothetical protein
METQIQNRYKETSHHLPLPPHSGGYVFCWRFVYEKVGAGCLGDAPRSLRSLSGCQVVVQSASLRFISGAFE